MMVDLFMKDGRTTFRFLKRGTAVAAMRRKPDDLDSDANHSLRCWARWHQGNEFVPSRVQLISPNSVAMVVQVPPEQRDAFLADHDNQQAQETAAA